MSGFSRAERVGALIQELLSEMLLREISDPRVRSATITGVRVTRDLRLARVYFATAAGSAAAAAAADGFRRASGFIKRGLGRQLGLRYTPDIEFFYDESFDRGAQIERLLKSLATENGSDRSGD
jgi:ribosome-binding factor A